MTSLNAKLLATGPKLPKSMKVLATEQSDLTRVILIMVFLFVLIVVVLVLLVKVDGPSWREEVRALFTCSKPVPAKRSPPEDKPTTTPGMSVE